MKTRARRPIALFLAMFLLFAPATSFAWVQTALAVGSAVVGIASSSAAGKAARESAAAQQAEFSALLRRMDALDVEIGQLQRELEAIGTKIEGLADEILRRENTQTAVQSVDLVRSYAEVLTNPTNYSSPSLIDSRFTLLTNELGEVARSAAYFGPRAIAGDPSAVAPLALLQEATILANLAVWSHDSNSNAARTIVRSLNNEPIEGTVERILRDHRVSDDDVAFGPVAGETKFPGQAVLRELIRYLEHQAMFWEGIVSPTSALGQRILDAGLVKANWTPEVVSEEYQHYFLERLDARPLSDEARLNLTVQLVNHLISLNDSDYGGLLNPNAVPVALVLVPYFYQYETAFESSPGGNSSFDTYGYPTYSYPDYGGVSVFRLPGGAFVGRGAVVPEFGDLRRWGTEVVLRYRTDRYVQLNHRFTPFPIDRLGRQGSMTWLQVNQEIERFWATVARDAIANDRPLFVASTRTIDEDDQYHYELTLNLFHMDTVERVGLEETLRRLVEGKELLFQSSLDIEAGGLAEAIDSSYDSISAAVEAEPGRQDEFVDQLSLILSVIAYTAAQNARDNTLEAIRTFGEWDELIAEELTDELSAY